MTRRRARELAVDVATVAALGGAYVAGGIVYVGLELVRVTFLDWFAGP